MKRNTKFCFSQNIISLVLYVKDDFLFFFFFKAKDGIRDLPVTGVQTCALPISACLSMALSAGLEQAGTPATRIETTAACTIDKVGDGFKITTMELKVRGKVSGIDQAKFQRSEERRVGKEGRSRWSPYH